MVFVFQVGAEKVADSTKAKKDEPGVIQKGEMHHAILLELAKKTVQEHDSKKSSGEYDIYAKRIGKIGGGREVSIAIPKGMSLENALEKGKVEVSFDGTEIGCGLGANKAELRPKGLTEQILFTTYDTFERGERDGIIVPKERKEVAYRKILYNDMEELKAILRYFDSQLGEFGPRE